MPPYAEIEKASEDEQVVRYKYTDSAGVDCFLQLNKVSQLLTPEPGTEEDMLYRAVARKVAAAWLDDGVAPDRLMVFS